MRRIGLCVYVFPLLLIATAPAGAGEEALSNFAAAQIVIGQPDFTGGLNCNQGASAAAHTLCAQEGAPALGKKLLYIPDSENYRVLGFKTVPTANDASANFVLGQTNFSNTSSGIGKASFGFVARVAVLGKKLFVVDFDNSRVLIWNKLPTKTDALASVVVGQLNFTSKVQATTQSGLRLPEGIAVAGGKLFVSDRNNNRILIWNKIPTKNGAKANVVVGQADFTSSVSATTRTGLSNPEGLWSDGKRLVVADYDNDRVLIWNKIPKSNGAPADVVVGEPDFITADNPEPPDAQSLNQPADVSSDGTSLFVADARNNRVLVYNPFPTTNNPAANVVLGQADFTHSDSNAGNGAPSAQTLSGPFGVSVIGKQLFVSDDNNSRVLIFNL